MKTKTNKSDPEQAHTQIIGAIADLSQAVGEGFTRVRSELTDIRQQLDRIETIVLADHQHRIEILERHMRQR